MRELSSWDLKWTYGYVSNFCESSWVYKLPLQKMWVTIDDLTSSSFHSGYDVAEWIFARISQSLNAAGEIGAVRADYLLEIVKSKPTYILDLVDCTKIAILTKALRQKFLEEENP